MYSDHKDIRSARASFVLQQVLKLNSSIDLTIGVKHSSSRTVPGFCSFDPRIRGRSIMYKSASHHQLPTNSTLNSLWIPGPRESK